MNYATERLLAAANASLTAWEGEEQSVREEHAATIEELEAALHYFDAHGDKRPPIRVVVALEGGLVQGAVADQPGVSVITIDYDVEGADADEVLAIPQDGGDTAEATRGGISVDHDPAWIDAAEAAELADPAAAAALLRKRASGCRDRGEDDRAAELEAEAARLDALIEDEDELTTSQGDPLRELEPQA